jgi:uncharacterized protein YqgQ
LVRSLTKLLKKYGLRKKIIAYLKNEGSNLNAMAIELEAVLNYESLGLEERFQNICFGHAFSKACQYDTVKEKECKDLKCVYFKSAQGDLPSASLGLISLEMEGRNGTRLVLKLAFVLEN